MICKFSEDYGEMYFIDAYISEDEAYDFYKKMKKFDEEDDNSDEDKYADEFMKIWYDIHDNYENFSGKAELIPSEEEDF